jgi:hypothetical protein
MNAEQRAGVVNNARYLRGVRPVDPEEIHEYVEGTPHPAVVRQVLREEAVSLGLRETDAGTFVPVADGTVSVDFDGVERFPERFTRRLEELLVGDYGPGWPSGESGDALRACIRELKRDYFAGTEVEYDDETALAYAIYHLPDNYAVAQYTLSRLADHGLLPTRLRVLDVGAGVGGPMLGVHDLLPDDCVVEYHAVEPSAAADTFEAFAGATRRGFRTELHRTTAEAFEPDGTFDVVLFANVLSELADPKAVASRYMDAVATDGSFVGIAPADREAAIGLRETERALEDAGYGVWGPQVRFWPGFTPEDRGWTFDVQPDLETPAFQRELDEAAGGTGEFRNVDVQYAFSVVRHDDERMLDVEPDDSRFAKLAASEEHVANRIDWLGQKLSANLNEGDGNPLFKVSDGSERVDHYAVLTRGSLLNDDLVSAGYGDLLLFENALLLWNDDEESYNLVVDDETVVDRVAG